MSPAHARNLADKLSVLILDMILRPLYLPGMQEFCMLLPLLESKSPEGLSVSLAEGQLLSGDPALDMQETRSLTGSEIERMVLFSEGYSMV